MSKQTILNQAIRLAKKNGWDAKRLEIYAIPEEAFVIIFNHDFAKALWGSRTVNALNGNKFVAKKLPPGLIETVYVDLAWEFHLKHMVVAPDPIKYLGDNI